MLTVDIKHKELDPSKEYLFIVEDVSQNTLEELAKQFNEKGFHGIFVNTPIEAKELTKEEKQRLRKLLDEPIH